MAKSETYRKLIHTTRWIRLRASYMAEHPCCQDCELNGLSVPATEVHHVTPCEYATCESEMERLMFDRNNLRALCHACHVEAHKAIGRSGRAAVKRRNEQQLGRVIARFFDDPGG